jgi:HEAT repeat protein
MKRIFRITTLVNIILLTFMLAEKTWCTEPTPKEEVKSVSPELMTEIADLIQKLGAADWQEREAAHKALLEIGPHAILQLKNALAETKDAEIRFRIDLILRDPKMFVAAVLTEEISMPEKVKKLLSAEGNIKGLCDKLAQVGGNKTIEVLWYLFEEERNKEVRYDILTALGKLGEKIAIKTLLQGWENPGPDELDKVTKALISIGANAVESLIEVLRKNINNQDISGRLTNILTEIKTPRTTELLVEVLRKDTNPEMRKCAVYILCLIKDPEALEPLIETLRKDPDKDVRWWIVRDLRQIEHPETVRCLIKVLQEEAKAEIRDYAADILAHILSKIHVPEAIDSLIELLKKNPDEELRWRIVHALGKCATYSGYRGGEFRDSKVTEALIETLKQDTSKKVRQYAAWALGTLKDPKALEPLLETLEKDMDIRSAVPYALGEIGDRRAVLPLIATLKTDDGNLCMMTVQALGKLKDPRAISPLIETLKHAEENVSWSPRKSSGGIREPVRSKGLIEHLQKNIAEALTNLTNQNFGPDYDQWSQWWQKNKAKFLEETK